jgi:broad specificity phosphatase PhoE
MVTLLLVRHGETDWNRDHKWQGHTGPPLNEEGRRQAREVAAQLADIDAIYSSDTIRAHETAEIIASQFELAVETDPRLREVNFGQWESLTRQQINERFGDALTRWLAFEQAEPDGGESDAAMAERVLDVLAEIAQRHAAERVVVVTSGGPIRAAQAHLQGIEQPTARRDLETVPNCHLVELAADGEAFATRNYCVRPS